VCVTPLNLPVALLGSQNIPGPYIESRDYALAVLPRGVVG